MPHFCSHTKIPIACNRPSHLHVLHQRSGLSSLHCSCPFPSLLCCDVMAVMFSVLLARVVPPTRHLHLTGGKLWCHTPSPRVVSHSHWAQLNPPARIFNTGSSIWHSTYTFVDLLPCINPLTHTDSLSFRHHSHTRRHSRLRNHSIRDQYQRFW